MLSQEDQLSAGDPAVLKYHHHHHHKQIIRACKMSLGREMTKEEIIDVLVGYDT